MCRTIHAFAVGAAVMCCAMIGTALTRAATWSVAIDDAPLENDDASPAAIVEQDPSPGLAIDADDAQSFHWLNDIALTPPAFVVGGADTELVAPAAASTAIPLPPAVWTGLAGLAALGATSCLRRVRLRR